MNTTEILKLCIAMLVGGLIGAEREFRDKSAGFRTILLITVGSTLFTILSLSIANEADSSRIAANIVTGIGFLGAGVILREGQRITGVTTAATIWLAAALGMGIGAGRYVLVGISTFVSLVILWFFPSLEHQMSGVRETLTYKITIPVRAEKINAISELFQSYGMKLSHEREAKINNNIVITIHANGTPENHSKLQKALIHDSDVIEMKC